MACGRSRFDLLSMTPSGFHNPHASAYFDEWGRKLGKSQGEWQEHLAQLQIEKPSRYRKVAARVRRIRKRESAGDARYPRRLPATAHRTAAAH